MEHINASIAEETRPMMYKMMKWWGGKPHNIWNKYIKTYTKPGELVLDPFCGRGVGVIEAVKEGRKAIGIDLNPIAIFQTKILGTHFDASRFKMEWAKLKSILGDAEKKCMFFTTKCTKCGRSARLATMNRDGVKPYRLFYLCTCTQKPLPKDPDEKDMKIITITDDTTIPWPYPKTVFPDTDAFKNAVRNYGDTYDTLFTSRNMYALACIFHNLNTISDDTMRKFFQFAFVSMVHLASKIPAVRENSNRVISGSWGRPGYIKVRKNMEMNPFMLFERAVDGRQGVIAGKTNSNRRLNNRVSFANNVNDLDRKTLLLSNANTLELDYLKPDTVDYVITDPPYGNLIPYFDLSWLWSSWLELVDGSFRMPFDDELTIDNRRSIPFGEYSRRMDIAFRHVFRVLKPGKYMTVTFHNDKPALFNSLLTACQDAGFRLEKILFQMNKRPGETGAASPWGTSVSDFYLRFKKPTNGKPTKVSGTIRRFENIVKKAAKESLIERGEPTNISAMIPKIYESMAKTNVKVRVSTEDRIPDILSSSPDFVQIRNGLWWLSESAIKQSNPDVPLSERVEESVIEILRDKYKVRYDQVLNSVFSKFQNSLTPSSDSIRDALKEYGIKRAGGYWRLKPEMSAASVRSKHTEVEEHLCRLGKRLGYDVYSPDMMKSDDMKRICIDFKPQTKGADRIRLIDVLWISGGSITHAFEVENTTTITSALERCSNIRDEAVRRILVIPSKRQALLRRKLREPLFEEYYEKDKWGILLYDALNSLSKKPKVRRVDFLKSVK